jgi:O-methyltransferase
MIGSVRNSLAIGINRALRPFGVQIARERLLREPWGSDATFLEQLRAAQPYTMMVPARLYVLYQFACYARTQPESDSAEVGTWRGGSSYLMASIANPRKHYVFDTFTGLPDGDLSITKGSFADTSAEFVTTLLKPLGNTTVFPGLFPETALAIENRRFSLVHLDVDLEAGTEAGLQFFYPRLLPGGVVVIDDYQSRHQGVTRAVDSFVSKQGIKALSFARGQAVIIKPQVHSPEPA